MKNSKFLAGAMLAIMMSATSIVNAQWQLTGNNLNSTDFIGSTTGNTQDMRFKLNNTQRMVLKSSNGNLGIGVTTPNSRLHVNSTGALTLSAAGILTLGTTTSNNMAFDVDDIQTRNNGAAGPLSINRLGGSISLGMDPLSTSTPIMHVAASSGNVGIGSTASSSNRLFVNGSTASDGVVLRAKMNYVHAVGNYSELKAVVGVATSDFAGIGVEGEGDYIGVRGVGNKPTAGSGNVVIGVYGSVNGSSTSENWAGYFNGKTYADVLCIGTTDHTYKLNVCGTIHSTEVRVESGWCDYVFANDYKLRPLNEVESFIKENKHLPDVTAGNIIETEGLDIGKTSSQMIRKIEELTLYVIELQKQVDELKKSSK